MYHPSEVELSETTKAVLAAVQRVNPSRVVFDSLSEMRLLAQNSLRYRRQILALKQFFIGRNCTCCCWMTEPRRAGMLACKHCPRSFVAGTVRARSTVRNDGGD